jgi:hypothetical protein
VAKAVIGKSDPLRLRLLMPMRRGRFGDAQGLSRHAGGDAWLVKRARARQADSVHENKSDAIARAKELAKSAELGHVKIHRSDGELQTEYTYEKDPKKTPG